MGPATWGCSQGMGGPGGGQARSGPQDRIISVRGPPQAMCWAFSSCPYATPGRQLAREVGPQRPRRTASSGQPPAPGTPRSSQAPLQGQGGASHSPTPTPARSPEQPTGPAPGPRQELGRTGTKNVSGIHLAPVCAAPQDRTPLMVCQAPGALDPCIQGASLGCEGIQEAFGWQLGTPRAPTHLASGRFQRSSLSWADPAPK